MLGAVRRFDDDLRLVKMLIYENKFVKIFADRINVITFHVV